MLCNFVSWFLENKLRIQMYSFTGFKVLFFHILSNKVKGKYEMLIPVCISSNCVCQYNFVGKILDYFLWKVGLSSSAYFFGTSKWGFSFKFFQWHPCNSITCIWIKSLPSLLVKPLTHFSQMQLWHTLLHFGEKKNHMQDLFYIIMCVFIHTHTYTRFGVTVDLWTQPIFMFSWICFSNCLATVYLHISIVFCV